MNITIDTKAKTIQIEENIKSEELYKGLQELLGENWKEYTIIPKITYQYYPTYDNNKTTNPNFDPFTTTCKTDSPFTETK